MTRQHLFLRMLFKAAWVRKDRALTALISVAVVATMATAALTLYSDLENKLNREFRSFGANVIVTPNNGELSNQQYSKIKSILGSHGESVPMAYVVAAGPNDSRVVVGGTNLEAFAQLNSWWSGRNTNTANGSALIGSRAAAQLSPSGEGIRISFGNKSIEVRPKTIFNSGSKDDSRIYLDITEFQRLADIPPQTVLVRVDGKPQEIQSMIAQLSASLPGVEVKPIRQITQAQTAVVDKTRSVVLAASAVIVVLIMLCMAATFTSSVLEQRKDFAVMKALGASNKTVNFLFAAEASMLALAGAAVGFLAGSSIAYWIGRANFDAAILPQPALLLPVLVGSVLLALLASTVPLRRLQQIQPAGILRGE